MASSADLAVIITGKDNASKVLGGINKTAGGLGETLGKVGTIAAGFLAANVIGKGASALTGFMNDSIEAVKESIQVNAQLGAVLKSTGNAAGVTAKEVTDLASALEKQSLFEDEAILQGQNLLLTFTNIRNSADGTSKVFDEATEIMLDMAQAMGTDAKGSAIQLGKALNDPTKGLTALTRVGVTFDAEQKKQIKTMQEAGNIAGAQAIILAELRKEFGGSAKAASDAAGATERYKDRMNELKEQIGTQMLPIQQKISEAKLAFVNLLVTQVIPVLTELYEKHWPGISAAVQKLAEEWIPKLQEAFTNVGIYIRDQLIPTAMEIGAFIRDELAPNFQEGARTVGEMAKSATALLEEALKPLNGWLGEHAAEMVLIIGGVAIAIALAFGPLGAAYLAIIGIILLIGTLKRNWQEIREELEKPINVPGAELLGNIASKGSVLKGIVGQSQLGALVETGIGVNEMFKASGGPVSAGSPYIVGERGPELFVPGRSGSIVPNGGGATQIINVYVSGGILSNRDLVEEIRKATVRGDFRGYLQAV